MSAGGGHSPRWRHDGKELFYLAPDNRLIGGFSSKAQYAVAPDGRFLTNVSGDDAAAAPITIVLNWDAALKK